MEPVADVAAVVGHAEASRFGLGDFLPDVAALRLAVLVEVAADDATLHTAERTGRLRGSSKGDSQ